MERMKRLLSRGLGRIGMGSIGSGSSSVRQGRGSLTRSLSDLTYQSLEKWEICVIGCLTLLVGFCLLAEILIGTGVIMATPESQGGIDYPDGGFASGSIVYPVSGDLGELAARIGSPTTHNREGNVIYMETFEHGLGAWWANGYGTGGEVITSAEKFRMGGYAAKLIAGSDGAAAAKIYRDVPYPALSNFGLEASWYPGTGIKQVDMVLARTDGTNEHQLYVRYDDTVSKIQIKDENGDFVDIVTGLDLTPTYASFHTMKVVGDFTNDTFLRLIINSTEYDLSDYAAYVFANADPKRMRVDLKLWGVAETNGYVYFDDIILTYNEPTRE